VCPPCGTHADISDQDVVMEDNVLVNSCIYTGVQHYVTPRDLSMCPVLSERKEVLYRTLPKTYIPAQTHTTFAKHTY